MEDQVAGRSRSDTTESDVLYDFYCELCKEDGKNLEAEGFCVDCGEYLCQICYTHHRRSRSSRHHELLSKDVMPRDTPLSHARVSKDIVTKCQKHKGETISYFCKTHYLLVCNLCFISDHRFCKEIESISEKSENILDSQEYKEFIETLKSLKVKSQGLISQSKANASKSSHCFQQAVRSVKYLRKEIDSVIDDIEKSVLEKAEGIKSENEERLKHVSDICNTALEKVQYIQTEFGQLDSSKQICQIYIKMKESSECVQHLQTELRQSADKNVMTEYTFVPNKTFTELTNSAGIFGTVSSFKDATDAMDGAITDTTRMLSEQFDKILSLAQIQSIYNIYKPLDDHVPCLDRTANTSTEFNRQMDDCIRNCCEVVLTDVHKGIIRQTDGCASRTVAVTDTSFEMRRQDNDCDSRIDVIKVTPCGTGRQIKNGSSRTNDITNTTHETNRKLIDCVGRIDATTDTLNGTSRQIEDCVHMPDATTDTLNDTSRQMEDCVYMPEATTDTLNGTSRQIEDCVHMPEATTDTLNGTSGIIENCVLLPDATTDTLNGISRQVEDCKHMSDVNTDTFDGTSRQMEDCVNMPYATTDKLNGTSRQIEDCVHMSDANTDTLNGTSRKVKMCVYMPDAVSDTFNRTCRQRKDCLNMTYANTDTFNGTGRRMEDCLCMHMSDTNKDIFHGSVRQMEDCVHMTDANRDTLYGTSRQIEDCVHMSNAITDTSNGTSRQNYDAARTTNAATDILNECTQCGRPKKDKSVSLRNEYGKPDDVDKVRVRTGKTVLNDFDSIKATAVADIDVCCSGVRGQTFISGSAVLSSGKLVVTSADSRQVTLVDTRTNKVVRELLVHSSPWDIAAISENQIAVTLPDLRQILLLRVTDRLSRFQLIHTHDKCYGVAYSHGSLVVSFKDPPRLKVIDLKGNVMKSIGDGLFQEPNYVCVSNDGETIYVSDSRKHMVIGLGYEGNVKYTYCRLFINPSKICVDHFGNVYMCTFNSGSVFLISPDLQKAKILLTRKDGLNRWDHSIGHCWETNRLFVSLAENRIKVFQLS